MRKIIIFLIVFLSIILTTITAVTIAQKDNNEVDLDMNAITYSMVSYGNTHFVNQDHNGHKINLLKDNEVVEYENGLTFHGYAVIRFDFDYNITGLKSDFGLNDCDRNAVGTSFKIKIIANGDYVYESTEINQRANFLNLDIELEPTNNFIIILDPLGNNRNDRVSFGNPKVIKEIK